MLACIDRVLKRELASLQSVSHSACKITECIGLTRHKILHTSQCTLGTLARIYCYTFLLLSLSFFASNMFSQVKMIALIACFCLSSGLY